MKRTLKIIGWILFFPLVPFVVFVLPISDDIAAYISVGLLIAVPLAAAWYKIGRQNKQDEENAIALSKTIIPENVGVRSYIDKKTGVIYLRSDNFETRLGLEWIISKNAVSIKKNIDNTTTRTPFTKINKIEFDSDFNSISFSIVETYRYDIAGDGSQGTEQGSREIMVGYICFVEADLSVAKAVYDRIVKNK